MNATYPATYRTNLQINGAARLVVTAIVLFLVFSTLIVAFEATWSSWSVPQQTAPALVVQPAAPQIKPVPAPDAQTFQPRTTPNPAQTTSGATVQTAPVPQRPPMPQGNH